MRHPQTVLAQPAPYHSLPRILALTAMIGVLLLITAAATFRAVQGAGIGSKTYVAESLCLVLLPLALYLAIARPFLFPFAFFILIAPLDPLLFISSTVGTVTKLVGLCCAAAFLFRIVRTRQYSPAPSAILLWLAFLAWNGLSVFWAIDPEAAVRGLVTYVLLVALYAVISLTPISAIEFRWLLVTIVLSGLIGAAGSLYLYHTGHIINPVSQGDQVSRLNLEFSPGQKLDPNSFAIGFLLPIAIVLAAALRWPWSLAKLGFIGLFITMVGGIYLLASRGAELALATLIGYMLIRSRFRGQLIAFTLVTLAASFLLPTSPFARFHSALTGGGSGRLSIWKVGLAAFKHHWLVGGGVGNFLTSYNESFISVYQRVDVGWHRAPHNIVLQVAVEFGVIGLALFLGAWYAQWKSMSAIPRSSQYFDIRIALEAALLSIFVAGLFGNILEHKVTWLVLAITALTRSFVLSQESTETWSLQNAAEVIGVNIARPSELRGLTSA